MFGTFLIKIVEKILLVQVIKIQAFIILQIDMIRLAQLYLYNTAKRITQRRSRRQPEYTITQEHIGTARYSGPLNQLPRVLRLFKSFMILTQFVFILCPVNTQKFLVNCFIRKSELSLQFVLLSSKYVNTIPKYLL